MDLSKPLAYRVRPKSLEEFVGQEHVVGKDKLLYRTIKADRLSSLILWGPPGCGKTSLAKVISETTKYKFTKLNAVTSGVGDIKKAIEEADNPLLNPSGKCILFIDEIHRFNKLQQDALLPYVEDGTVILIGATTENPYFEVNKALISRSMVIKLEPLKIDDVFKVLKNALVNKDGLGSYKIKINDDTLRTIAEISNGDVRTALNGLEVAVLTTKMNSDGVIEITDEIASQSMNTKKAMFDKSGDSHYDNISAMIKSMRGSDPDAAIFYLARALNEELILGAGLDVLGKEPIDHHNALFEVKDKNRLLITPHIAWASVEARNQLIQEVVMNIEALKRQENRNRIV